jgi:hypothetical protein
VSSFLIDISAGLILEQFKVQVPIGDFPSFKLFYYIPIVAVWILILCRRVHEYQRLEERNTSIFRAEVTDQSLP